MIKQTTTFLISIFIFSAAFTQTQSSVISDDFDWQSTGVISAAGTGSNRETILKSTSTGFSWGGHNAATTGDDIEATSGKIEFKGTSNNASNVHGSYVYTIFSSSGNATPSQYINLTDNGATFKLYFKDANPLQSFRLILRDINGDWFISRTDYSKGVWSNTQGLGTPKVVDELYNDIQKAYPINTFLWNKIDGSVATSLNSLSSNDNVEITASNSASNLDLSKITGAGIYVEEPLNSTTKELIIERFELHSYEPLVIYNPAYSSHYITTKNGVKWGFSNLGGGGSGEFYYPDADPNQNLNASGWGRAFQSAWRSFYHGGGYNPTQGGRTRNHGAPTPMSYGTSSTGSGTRVDYGPFKVPTMGRPDNDILTYWDLTNGEIPGGADTTKGSDNDGLNESGLSEADEVITEYDMTGFYEDVSNVITNSTAEAIRIYNQYDYIREPSMILQFKQEISTNFANGIKDLVEYTVEKEVPDSVKPTRIGIFWGDRLWTDKFTQVWVWDSTSKALVSNSPIPDVQPGGTWPSTHERLTILSGPGDDSTAYSVGMYFPEWSQFNQKCIAGVETSTGYILYEEDRMVPNTLEYRWGLRGSGADIIEQGSGNIIKDFVKRDIGFDVVGMVNPRILDGKRVHERLRFELFHLVGTPKEILKAVKDIDAYFDPDLRISSGSTHTLSGPKTVRNLYLKNGTLDLNGHRLTITNGISQSTDSANYYVQAGTSSNPKPNSELVFAPSANSSATLFMNPNANTLKLLELGTNRKSVQLTLGNSVNIKGGKTPSNIGSLRINKGSKLIIANTTLTLKCDTFNAFLELSAPAQRAIHCSGTGKFNIERQHYGARGWRLYSHPFKKEIDLQEIADDIELIGSGGTAEKFYSDTYKNTSAYWYDYSKADTSQASDPAWTPFTSAKGSVISGNPNKWGKHSAVIVFNPGAERGSGAFSNPSTAKYQEGQIGLSYTLDSNSIHLNDGTTQVISVAALANAPKSRYFLLTNPFTAPVRLCRIQGLNTTNCDNNFYFWKQDFSNLSSNFMPGTWQSQALFNGNDTRDSNVCIPAFGTILLELKNTSTTFTIPENAKQLTNFDYIIGSDITGQNGGVKQIVFNELPVQQEGPGGIDVQVLINDSFLVDRLLIYDKPEESSGYTNNDAKKFIEPSFTNIYTIVPTGESLGLDVQDITSRLTNSEDQVEIPLVISRDFNKQQTNLRLRIGEKHSELQCYFKDAKTGSLFPAESSNELELQYDANDELISRYSLVFKRNNTSSKDIQNNTQTSNSSIPHLLIYPNPVGDQLHVRLLNQNSKIPFRIFNFAGVQILDGTIQNLQVINTSELPSGVYFIQANGQNVKFLKN